MASPRINSALSIFEDNIRGNSEHESSSKNFISVTATESPTSFHRTISKRGLAPLRERSFESTESSVSAFSEEVSQSSSTEPSDEDRFERPITLSWEEQRTRISKRDTPKEVAIPKSPSLNERKKAFDSIKIAIPSPPLIDFSDISFSGNTFASGYEASTVCHENKTILALAATFEDDDSCSAATFADDDVTVDDDRSTGMSVESDDIDTTSHVSQFVGEGEGQVIDQCTSEPIEEKESESEEASIKTLEAAPVIAVRVEAVAMPTLEEFREDAVRMPRRQLSEEQAQEAAPRCEPTRDPLQDRILPPYKDQHKALVQRRLRQSKNKVVVPKSPMSLSDRLRAFEVTSLDDDDTCSLTSNHSTPSSSLW